MISLLVKERLYLNEVVLGTAFGVLMGPHVADIFNPRSWTTATNTLTLEVMRVVLATGLFAIGVELPRTYMAKHAKSLLVMVVPTMAFGWGISAVFIHLLFPRLDFISALAISACLTPTDPVICAAIVGGSFAIKNVPVNLRRLLAAESASNDGLAYPFLSISIYLTTEVSRRTAIGKWFLIGWLYQVILGIILGAVIGFAFSRLMKFTHHKGFIDRESFVAQYLALAIFTIGIASTLGTDDLLAAFAAGSTVSWDGNFNLQIENEVFSSVIDLVLNCACFIYIGAWLPFDQFNSPELGITPGRLLALFMCLLVLRRIPPLLMLYNWIPEIRSWKEALFSGHFGPMGVGAVFISTLALNRLEDPQSPPQNQQQFLAACLQPIVSFIVLGSIVTHGLSIPFFSFGRTLSSRTLSLSRTLTRQNENVPDWLLWARRDPLPPGTAAHSHVDVEQQAEPNATKHDDMSDTATMHAAPEVENPALGIAGMLDKRGPGALSLSRRTSQVNPYDSDEGVSGPSSLGVDDVLAKAGPHVASADGGVADERPLGVEEGDDTETVRSPRKAVRFPESQ
ncbi:hypothetical protein BV25DRAFT_1824218 [Artomyces pyxidatus]|uniref:Uncharacterized protein n=1 Tax=Artomyces pyxidatus TaxID=48021 RepID=A0ACB8T5W6_9AGAM|nr:hypothetical protein BV25DRAFT_1824218 [Artomyces pyxidatus]